MNTEKWLPGVNPGTRHWVVVPSAVKGINAGNAERAALIVKAVNGYGPAMEVLAQFLESVFPAVSDGIQAAHDFFVEQGGTFAYDERGQIHYRAPCCAREDGQPERPTAGGSATRGGRDVAPRQGDGHADQT